jgi:hypothetical protein
MKKDNIRRASNETYFSTIDGRTGWKIVKETDSSRQIVLTGNTESMLAGLLEKKEKFDELGVTVLGKKTDTGLIIEVAAK